MEHRKHLGILEKKKDYIKRSADFKQKNAVINKLSVKAQLRNPNEYYHKMKKMKKHDETGEAMYDNRPKTIEEKTNMRKQRTMTENQNIALTMMRRTIEMKKAERMQKNLHLIDFNK